MYTLGALNESELATSSMGQGFNSTTIQNMNAFAAVINGGKLMKPYVVAQVIDGQGNVTRENKPTVQRIVISKETSKWMRESLLTVMDPGKTGRSVAIDGYEIGGKTGTAEQDKRDSGIYSLSCIAFLSAEAPELMVGVFMDSLKTNLESSQTVAPLTRELLQDIITYKGIKPTQSEAAAKVAARETGGVALPDYSGKSIAEAIHSLNGMRLDVELMGDSGDTVSRQFPAASKLMNEGDKVSLYIERSADISDLIPVPDTTGLTAEQAVDLLNKAGFSPIVLEDKTETTEPDDTPDAFTGHADTVAEPTEQVSKSVYQQQPSPDKKIPSGVEVTIKVR
jgi:stage V sporulation protein D (sporulation-specific penicillin-binding protein)